MRIDGILRTIPLVALFGLSSVAKAGVLDRQSTNIQVLYGADFELGPEERTIITLEHANGFKNGDNYFFLDYTTDQNSFYGEWVPRLSLSKLTGKDFGFGPIKDFLIAGTVEFPTGIDARHAAGGKAKEGKLFLGFEYRYWSDKFGAGITSENVLQLNLKIVL